MSTGATLLSIDYGSASTVAVLAWPDGRYLPVSFDGANHLPSAVSLDSGGPILTGAQAWQQAAVAPEGFEATPIRHLTDGELTLGDRRVSAVDLIAATLRRAGEQATLLAGGPVSDVRLVVPASWGPRRRTLLRQAAHRAGLARPSLVEGPIAAAWHLLATGAVVPVGGDIAVCDFGAGFEATVLRCLDTGFEVLATIPAPHAGGMGIDAALAAHLTAITATGQPAADASPAPVLDSPTLLDKIRVAKEALTHTSSVLVPMPAPHPATVLSIAQLSEVAHEALQPAVEATKRAIDAADITPQQLAGLYCVGGSAHLPAVAALLRDSLGVTPTVAPQPTYAAALGAAHATTPADTDHPQPQQAPTVAPPRVRRSLATLVPGLASLALLAQTYVSATFEPGAAGNPQYAYVLANWGGLAMSSVLALIAALTAATVIAAALAALQATTPTDAPPTAAQGSQIGTGLLAAVALGMSVAGLYALTGALYFGLPNGPFLRWALLPPLPIALIVSCTAVLVLRLGKSPTGAWERWLHYPPSSVLTAAAGMMTIEWSLSSPTYAGSAATDTIIGHVGGLLLGIGAALALARSTTARIITSAPLAVFTMLITSYPATGVLGIIYTAAATAWWSRRILDLLRRDTWTADA